MERCPLNSYCNKQTNRCCVKGRIRKAKFFLLNKRYLFAVITAVLPYRMCLEDRHCGRNMICLNGLCQCAKDDMMPVRKKRECSNQNIKFFFIS